MSESFAFSVCFIYPFDRALLIGFCSFSSSSSFFILSFFFSVSVLIKFAYCVQKKFVSLLLQLFVLWIKLT